MRATNWDNSSLLTVPWLFALLSVWYFRVQLCFLYWFKHILFRYKVHTEGLSAAENATLPSPNMQFFYTGALSFCPICPLFLLCRSSSLCLQCRGINKRLEARAWLPAALDDPVELTPGEIIASNQCLDVPATRVE